MSSWGRRSRGWLLLSTSSGGRYFLLPERLQPPPVAPFLPFSPALVRVQLKTLTGALSSPTGLDHPCSGVQSCPCPCLLNGTVATGNLSREDDQRGE